MGFLVRARHIALLAIVAFQVSALTVGTVSAKPSAPVSFSLSGYVTGVERMWAGDDDPTLHFRATSIAASVSGGLSGTAFVTSASDLDAVTGDGNHRGELTILTAGGSLSGRFEGRTTAFTHLEGTWVATHGAGSLEGVKAWASYVGDFYLSGTLVFSGFMQ